MNYKGKTLFSLTIVSPAELEAESDRILASHAEWVARSHQREGEKALLQYSTAKRVEEDGSVTYFLSEVYETISGLQDHIEQANSNWETFADFGRWLGQCKVIGGHASPIHSLW